jgi:hypothetical protein
MNLVWNWKEILKEAWSIRFSAVAGLLSGFAASMSYMPAGFFGASPEVWTLIQAVLTGLSAFIGVIATPFSRLIDQGLGK